ncbi:YraN family protein [Dongshaea marina]|uniref:YraN family protein n=1 Tax=Dongshaea marina TaxID=2047966 RepID=UPI001F293465|nr:YraN family protein [Dongshaea marina]
MTLSSRQLGEAFEKKAIDYLRSQGLKLRTKNYGCRSGELDLIMESGSTLIFVEVRYRASDSFGGALASVTPAKQQKIRRAAQFYLQQQGLNEHKQLYRFDVVAFSAQSGDIEWIQNAF